MFGVTAPQVWNAAVHAQETFKPHAETVPQTSPALPAAHTGFKQHALAKQVCVARQVEVIVPPQLSLFPLSLQLAGVSGAQVQVPATVALEPLHTLFWVGTAAEQGQVRFVPPGPSWNTLLGTVEQAFPMPPVAL